MMIIDDRFKEIIEKIEDLINETTPENRDEQSSLLMSLIRNFYELVMYKIYNIEFNVDLHQTTENLSKVKKYFKDTNSNIYKQHKILNTSGHIFWGKDQSESLAIKYIPMLIEIKQLLQKKYNLTIFNNINQFPLNLNNDYTDIFRKIKSLLINKDYNGEFSKNLYYIVKKRMKYIDNVIFYEYTLDTSDDKIINFNEIVAYSLENIESKYDMIFRIAQKNIKIFNNDANINIITEYKPYIRPCAFKNLLLLIGCEERKFTRTNKYDKLMNNLKHKKISLLNMIEDKEINNEDNDEYDKFLKEVKSFISTNKKGVKIIKYLLLTMRNRVIRGQINLYNGKIKENYKFDYLPIDIGTLAFEINPIAFSPKIEKPSLYDLAQIVDLDEYKHEIIYRKLEQYINEHNTLFVSSEMINMHKKELENLINVYNDKLYCYYKEEYKIIKINDYYTINFYYKNTDYILKTIKELSNKISKLDFKREKNEELSKDKNEIIKNAFIDSSVAILTGSAGTGKTKLIKEFIKRNYNKKILYLTTTNSVKNNIKSSESKNIIYLNTYEYLTKKRCYEFDLVIIDEASFISTKNFKSILENNNEASFFIVGDPMQIQSIEFGNWFSLITEIFKNEPFVYNLSQNHRAECTELQKVWDEVRNYSNDSKDDKVLEMLSTFNYSKRISDKIFEKKEDQVVLCMSYDGLYGINNMNKYLQPSSENHYFYQQNTYCIGDPIIFINNDYDYLGIYNNLKGKILDIEQSENKIMFKIDINKELNQFGLINNEISIGLENKKSIVYITKKLTLLEDYDEDSNKSSKLPFQLSYAMSIHKSQGLEFDSVKIIFPEDLEGKISKEIFYTAITRARKNLEIFWNPEECNKILNNIKTEKKLFLLDVSIFKEKYK